eukprot:COSAG04_NODE_4544_length_2025_cov_1.157840_1_plen_344_part_00
MHCRTCLLRGTCSGSVPGSVRLRASCFRELEAERAFSGRLREPARACFALAMPSPEPMGSAGPALPLLQKRPPRPVWVNFATGAAGALSGWMLVHPFDLLKVRKQLLGEAGKGNIGMGRLAKDIIAKEGPTGLYGGLSAAVARQLSYGNLRLGLYQTFKEAAFGKEQDPTGASKLGLGLASGGVASFLSNPIEVSLVRMQADGRLPAAERRNYSNVFSALYRIGAEDGAAAYMAGVGPTVARAMIVNMFQVKSFLDVMSCHMSRSVSLILNASLRRSAAMTWPRPPTPSTSASPACRCTAPPPSPPASSTPSRLCLSTRRRRGCRTKPPARTGSFPTGRCRRP